VTSSPPGTPSTPTVGTLCIVLHTHLPWVAGHGTWPVGEEWLHQAWSASYLPVVEVLTDLAAEGRRDLLSLGVTPVLAAQLDDPYCLREQHSWLARWQLRATELATRPGAGESLRAIAALEHRAAVHALDRFGSGWRHGGSAALRPLVDAGVVELLGGPATHPVLPLLPEPLARLALTSGLDDTAVRLGRRPAGVWLPECAVGPGLEGLLAENGVDHVMVDEATLVAGGGSTDRVWLWGDVAVVGRDLGLTDLVWSSRSGFPGGTAYRDFHHLDDGSGFRPYRVTSSTAAPKAPYDPAAAAALARTDAARFATAVRDRLLRRSAAGEQPLAVVAWDTELFGHWWQEGPEFLAHALRMLPEAGVRLATLADVTAEGRTTAAPVDLPVGSWGHGKDLRLWSGAAVADLAADHAAVGAELLSAVRRGTPPSRAGRDAGLAALAREGLLLSASDWAFMVSRDSAAAYARDRHAGHLARFRALLAAWPAAPSRADPGGRSVVVPHLDARAVDARVLRTPGMRSRLTGQREVSPAVEVSSEV
jgi:1,4-alpha-glucan branching enzyme